MMMASLDGILFSRAKPFAYPAGLYGGNSESFLIPRDVQKSEGYPGHSS